jgi:hypothetical protein
MNSSEVNPKIIDLIKKKEAGSKPFVSIEFFPPRTDEGVKVRGNRATIIVIFCCHGQECVESFFVL